MQSQFIFIEIVVKWSIKRVIYSIFVCSKMKFSVFCRKKYDMTKLMILASLVLGLVLAVIPHVLWVITWICSKCFHFSVSYAPFGISALVLVVLLWLILAYGFFIGRFRLDVNHIEYANKDIPQSFDGYKIVHISDLHLSTFDDRPSELQKFVDSINAQNPDLICFTGDLVTIGVSEAEPYTSILRGLRATDGVVSVLGNHDFLIYARNFNSVTERENAVIQLAEYEKNELNWNLLRNENYVVQRGDDKITIVGVDNQCSSNQGFRTISRGDLPRAVQGTDGFRILLTHDPSHWRGEVLPKTDIPLTLSGHTHAAQIKLFGKTPASLSFIETDGLYTEGDQSLYINVGLGCTLPVRIGANAEITVITLHQK